MIVFAMRKILYGTIATGLFIGTFAAIMWFFDAPSVGRAAIGITVWLATLGACYVAGKAQ